jgi:hypothetical protein
LISRNVVRIAAHSPPSAMAMTHQGAPAPGMLRMQIRKTAPVAHIAQGWVNPSNVGRLRNTAEGASTGWPARSSMSTLQRRQRSPPRPVSPH